VRELKLKEREQNDDQVTEQGRKGIRHKEKRDGQYYIQCLLPLLTMWYIYYKDMRFTCNEPWSESDGLCTSVCPVAMWPKVDGSKV